MSSSVESQESALLEQQTDLEGVKEAVIDFYNVQKEFERSDEEYLESKEELHHSASNYLSSNLDMEDEVAERQASRFTTEVGLGYAHIYDTLDKLDAINELYQEFEGEN